MAAIAVTDVRVELLPTANPAGAQPADQVVIMGKLKMSRVRFSISATKGLAYPSSGGIPLPTFKAAGINGDSSFGMVRNVSHVKFYDLGSAVAPTDPNQTQALFKYDATNHVIRGFWESHATSTPNASATGFVELPTTWKPSFGTRGGLPLTFTAEVYGW
jgi:hypothetical protein